MNEPIHWCRANRGGTTHECYCTIGRDHTESEHEEQMNAPKPFTFTLTITLGNDAMQYDGDVGRALIELGQELASVNHPEFEMSTIDPVSIRDTNGNTVGSWAVQ